MCELRRELPSHHFALAEETLTWGKWQEITSRAGADYILASAVCAKGN